MDHTHGSRYTIVIFAPAVEGGYDVSFPELPGCVTFGRTMNEAKIMAREVLSLWLEECSPSRTIHRPRARIANMLIPKRFLASPKHHETVVREKTHSRS